MAGLDYKNLIERLRYMTGSLELQSFFSKASLKDYFSAGTPRYSNVPFTLENLEKYSS